MVFFDCEPWFVVLWMWTLNWQSVSSWKFGRLWSRQEKMKLEYKQTLKKTIILWYMLGHLVPKNLRSWNVFNLVYFTIYSHASCFIAWVSLCHHFFHLYYLLYLCFSYLIRYLWSVNGTKVFIYYFIICMGLWILKCTLYQNVSILGD